MSFFAQSEAVMMEAFHKHCKENQHMKEQFTDIKIGDRVWSINYGWGDITTVQDDFFYVNFTEKKVSAGYYFCGRRAYNSELHQSLFWNEIAITPPPRPVREVTHIIERWVNVYPDGSMGVGMCSRRAAEEQNETYPHRIACVRLTGTYTTMEE